MNHAQLIPLIYKTAIEQGAFIQLMDALTDGAASLVDEQELLVHFDQATEIVGKMSQLQHQQAIAQSIFNRLKTGIVLLDCEGKPVFSNRPAKDLLQGHAAVSMIEPSFVLTSAKLQARLNAKLKIWSQGINAEAETLLLQSTDNISDSVAAFAGHVAEGAQPIVAVLSQISEVSELLSMHVPDSVVGALFFSYSATTSELSSQRLKQLYGLTPVEADITCRLATGQTIDEIAEQRSSKSRTIRGYLKAVFIKTGVSRQADLISLVLNAPLQVTDAKKIVMQYGKDGLVTLPEKNISYREYGPENGKPMVLCHASLSCRYGVPLHLPLLEKYQIRLIVPERGGVGLSSGAPYQKITDFAADFRALIEHLQLKVVDVIGVVAGGAYALSAAWLCPDMVSRVLLLEGFAPNIAEHTIKGAPGYFRMMPRLIRHFPKVSERLMSFQLRDFANDWQKALQHTSKLFNPFDAQILLREDVRDHALIEGIENNRQGVSALIRDILFVHADWQIPLEDIKSPCYIAYGNADPVAACYAETLIQRLPNTRQVFREDEGFARMLYLSFFEIIEQAGWVEVKSENLPAEKVGDGNLYPA